MEILDGVTKKFSNAVCERIGNYVYALKDPRTQNFFYIGKGKGCRIFHHLVGAIKNPIKSDKLDTIREIVKEGKEVEHFILRHRLTEERALEIESACIDLLGLDLLTNEVKGHDAWECGLKTTDEIVQYYDAKVVTIREPAIIININKRYKRFMKPNDLYQVTRFSWVVGPKRNKARYAIASYRGLVREVYQINDWKKAGSRWEFIGHIADPTVRNKYINQSLKKYIKLGAQNPIRYTF